MVQSTVHPHTQPETTSNNPSPQTPGPPVGNPALPLRQPFTNPASKKTTTKPSTSPFLSAPLDIHFLIFHHLDSIHTLCLLTKTCKQFRTFWLTNALCICSNRAKHLAEKGCELAILQQRDADIRIPKWGDGIAITARDRNDEEKDEEKEREQANRKTVNKEIATHVLRNNAIVLQAGENLISQLQCEKISN
ncbi:MAG: hypothetical protein Q9168_007038, partial [Polycauliona sp. 1 TL-2023]